MCTTSPLSLSDTLSKATPQHNDGPLSGANLTISHTAQRPRNKILTANITVKLMRKLKFWYLRKNPKPYQNQTVIRR